MAEPEASAAAPVRESGTIETRTRQELVDALDGAARSALRVACVCLYAGCSLMNDKSEGGLTERQAVLVRGWKASLTSAAFRGLADLARASDALAALGGPPPSRAAPPPLRPYSQALMEELSGHDGDQSPETTVDALLAGDATVRPTAAALLASVDGDHPVTSLDRIRAEFLAEVSDARQAGVAFEPVRPVVVNPALDGAGEPGSTPVRDERTATVGRLFAEVWDTVLAILVRPPGTVGPGTDPAQVARLVSSVVRPLGEALAQLPLGDGAPGACAGPIFTGGGDLGVAQPSDRLWRLAREATQLRTRFVLPDAFTEATAALQDLAVRAAPADGPDSGTARLAELRETQAELAPGIHAALNGPYLVTNVDTITNWLGIELPVPPQVALCRCGASATKPLCDGSHALVGFSGVKKPERVPDRRDSYPGLQITVLDNRGICAHSGFCTDRLSTVFHAGQERFVTASGARQDDIVRAVRSCPSGALSYAIDGVEARDQVDQDRPPAIEVSKDGPYRVTGGVALTDGHGRPEPRDTGVSLEHYSLCRCGQSQNKPFCSGMHWYVNFADPPAPQDPNLFEWAGGFPALRRMTRLFYAKYVSEEPLLAGLFSDMLPDHPDRVAAWLGEVFGGPKVYTGRYGGYPRMISQHVGKGITEPMRGRWAALLQMAADDAGLPADPEFRAAFVAYIEWGSRIAVENSTTGAKPPEGLPVPRWWWVCDATPAARASALAPEAEEPPPPPPPGADEPVSFAEHIRPLFRSRDRNSMKFAFDLWSHDDVCQHGAAIVARLRAGSMPCDGVWPTEWIAVLQRWLDSGMAA